MEFKDHFSENSDAYRRYRPLYPEALYDHLAAITNEQQQAWDCATGSGQTAHNLSKHYAHVLATDASQAQIDHAIAGDNIEYRVAAAEHTDIAANSIDLVTVSQALHWFDIRAFATEVARVLKPGGVLAVWSYNLLHIQPDVDALVNHLYHTMLAKYWPEEREMIEHGYRDIYFPFKALPAPLFQMNMEWNVEQLSGYLKTWSAVKMYQKDLGVNPVDMIYDDIVRVWGQADHNKRVTWPLALKLWRNV